MPVRTVNESANVWFANFESRLFDVFDVYVPNVVCGFFKAERV